jgi:glycosyltransferase involved in cell wall biosynthesis
VRLVFATQTIDADDPNLAATIDKVRALAARCERVVVLCDRVARHDLPANVEFEAFAAPSRLRRTLRFEAGLTRSLRPRPSAVLAHMVPEYAVLSAPLVRPLGLPLLLWYTHWSQSRMLQAATRLSSAILSVDRRSFPLESPKVHGIGHGIDLDRFAPRDRPAGDGPLRFLALGRIAPWKGLETLLRGFEIAALDATLEIRGPAVNQAERRHRDELERLIGASPFLREHAALADPVTRDRIPELLAAADAVVSPIRAHTRGGTLDKVVFEATACAVPVLTSNPNLAEYLGGLPVPLLFRPDDADDLARALKEFEASSPDARAEAGRELRRRAQAGHSVGAWADSVLRVAAEVRGR